ncbi:carbamate kinase [Candidatus Sumerlaeota bacterium]|nr:carbamate kinase [Candidatus Sumerlaeota bacterium]
MDLSRGVILALGGNSISPKGATGTIEQQWDHTEETMAEIADLWVKHRWPLVLTHGNGPQVGRILLRGELAAAELDPLPLDVAVADSQAGIGYMIQHILSNHLIRRGMEFNTVTLVTRVEVREDDPGFANPTKPIGRFHTPEEAEVRMRERGWLMIDDAGRGWRRVVASPKPLRIVEIGAIAHLLQRGDIVIAAGGGGIPVFKQPDNTMKWCECVIDKDLASALLAQELGIPCLVIITAVPRVCLDWGKETQREVDHLTADEAREHLEAGQFPAGSMGPKIEAAVLFAESGGTTVIAQSGELEAALEGRAGTRIVPS